MKIDRPIQDEKFDHKDEFLSYGYKVLSDKGMGEFPKGTFKN